MTRRIKLLLLVLIAIIGFVFVLPYLLVQTELGSGFASQLISRYNDDYHVSFERVTHSLAQPYELTIENIKIQDKQKNTLYFGAKTLVIGLKKEDLLQTRSFEYIFIEQGDVELSTLFAKNIDTHFLQLKNVSLHYSNPEQETDITLKNVYGGIKPWSNQLITHRLDSRFNLTIQKVTYNQFNIQSLFIQGQQKEQTLELANIGGNINQGFFTAKANILPDNSLEINQLKLNKINFQSEINSLNFNELLPKMSIAQLSILNSSISIPHFLMEKGNLEAKNLIYDHKWLLQNSELLFNAQSIIWGDELIEQPLLQWHSDGKITTIEHAMVTWNKGNIKITGNWQADQLEINSMIASGIRYQLPENWYHKLSEIELPNLSINIVIKQFMLMPSLLIDTNPDLPFQFSLFEAFGHDLRISTVNNQLQIEGDILLKADNATLNTVELKHPDLTLRMLPNGKDFSFSALIDDGIIEGSIILLPNNQLSPLIISTHGVSSDILPLWHLVQNPIKTNKFSLELRGQLQPLSLDGIFQTNRQHYVISNNELINH